MELTNLNHIELNNLERQHFDCMIATSGPQPRCHYLAGKLHKNILRKLVLTQTGDEQKQDKFLPVFKEYGFTERSATFNDLQSIESILNEVCNVQKQELNILIDYSCMPKIWYALFIDGITRNDYPARSVNFYLSYTPKIFEKKPGKHAIDYFGPIISNRDKLKEKKPVSMIFSLDHSNNTVMEAINKVKPQKLLAFLPHCPHDPDYTRLVQDNNKSLLDKIDPKNIIPYKSDCPEEINALLTSCCLDERMDSEVVIVPQGPKTFSMMSMLLSVRYPDVKLWEIIFKELKINPEHGQPAANPVIVKVSFIHDELD